MTLLTLALTLSTAAFAAAPGTLEGICTISTNGVASSHSFSVPANGKAVLGYDGIDDGGYKVSVVNNTGNAELEQAFGALIIGFSRMDASFRNPPLLCPTSPEELRRECEEENRRNNPPRDNYPRDRFTAIENNGSADAEANFRDGGFTKTTISSKRAVDGLAFLTPVATLGGVKAECSATFHQR